MPRPVIRSYDTPDLDEVERIIWSRLAPCARILDIGAGDNRMRDKFVARGYAGRFETLDVSREFEHDYASLDEAGPAYDGVLVLDVIEHLCLDEFFPFLESTVQRLAPRGILVISTPNPACVFPMWATDMTHVQQYPLNDLLALLLEAGFDCEAYRVVYGRARWSLRERVRLTLKKLVATGILGLDYADGLLVVATVRGGE